MTSLLSVQPALPRVEPEGFPASEHRLDLATNALLRTRPALSAGAPLWWHQRTTLMVLASGSLAGALFAPRETLTMLLAILVLPFLCVIGLRAVALWLLEPDPPRSLPDNAAPDVKLPLYTILVPLFRESEVVPDLIAALCALDYPVDRLEVFLITETVDESTRSALQSVLLPAHFRVLMVPDGAPRTKPRALNYALQEAVGDYVTVYDAEDIPEPRQLRDALALLNSAPERIGCVQARLQIYNAPASWLTRQFTIEYAALFDALLPALERLQLPVPLGGTSNHFPRRVLNEIGGWDPYNVTEDADLGIRLARAGYAVRILNSATAEEAPAAFGAWLRQRTRWLKGWMQTYLVHMREPLTLWRQLGPKRTIGFQILMGGLLLSALVHPWFYILAAADLSLSPGATTADWTHRSVLWWLCLLNLVAGYVTAVLLGAVASVRRHGPALAVHALLMPIYWLAISLAAYRALGQLITQPYLWEKTDHAARSHVLTVPTANL